MLLLSKPGWQQWEGRSMSKADRGDGAGGDQQVDGLENGWPNKQRVEGSIVFM